MGERSRAILRGLAANTGLPFDVVRPLLDAGDRETSWTLADRADITPEAVDHLASHSDVLVRKHLADNPAAAVRAASRLLADPDSEVRHRLVVALRHQPVPEDLLHRLAHDEDDVIRGSVAGHEIDEELALLLARDSSAHVRVRLALSDTSESVRRVLLTDPDPHVRYAATVLVPPPQDLLEDLFAHEATREAAVRCGTPTRALAEHAEPTVRRGVANNPSTPLSLLLGLADDPVPYVREAVMVHPALPDDVRAHVEATVTPRPHHLASWLLPARASLEERLRHVDSPFVFFRRAIASSTDFPQDAVDRLAADTDQRVLLDLAAHHDTVPGDVLAKLVPEVGKAKWRLAKHPALRPEPFAASDDSQLRIFAALSPNLTPATAFRLTADENRAVRLKVAANSVLPLETVLELLEAAEYGLVTAAASNPRITVEIARQLVSNHIA